MVSVVVVGWYQFGGRMVSVVVVGWYQWGVVVGWYQLWW